MEGNINWILESPAWFSVLQEFAISNGWRETHQEQGEELNTWTYQKQKTSISFTRHNEYYAAIGSLFRSTAPS